MKLLPMLNANDLHNSLTVTMVLGRGYRRHNPQNPEILLARVYFVLLGRLSAGLVLTPQKIRRTFL